MNSSPGTYVLVIRSEGTLCIRAGRWGCLDVRPGHYLYVGSAFGPGGVKARVSRHCRTTKRKHWHIDFLREVTEVESVWYSHAALRLEHDWAYALAGLPGVEPISGFGCTDCRCESHLFFSEDTPQSTVFAAAVGDEVRVCSGDECG